MLNKLLQIYNDCKETYPSQKQKQSGIYSVPYIFTKFFSFYPAYLLNKINCSANQVTFISYIFLFFSSINFIFLNVQLAVICLLMYNFLDFIDGDLARISKKKSAYGQMLDSLGADIFYYLIPISVSFLTYNIFLGAMFNDLISRDFILINGIICSFLFIIYRMIGLKNHIVILDRNQTILKKKEKLKKKYKFLYKFLNTFFNHEFIRGNFFSAPGMIYFFSFFLLLELYKYLIIYIITINLFNFFRLLKLCISIFFLISNNSRK